MPPRARPVPSLCAAAALTAGLVLAPAPAASAADGAPAEPTPGAVRDFLDERVPALLAEHGVPGAVVSVVADGEQVFAGGYGLADAASGTAVDVDRASFPLASVSKSFTAVAVLQLAERGDVDLHADVNEYLPERAQLPDTHPGQPVTLHHLLTHTAGFEEAVVGMFTEDPAERLPLADYVVDHRPDRVYPPGDFVAYSNYGTSLAGYVVEEVSGTPFAQYVAEHVFAPLGMERSAFATPDEAAGRLHAPALHGPSPDVPAPVVYLNQVPAGGAYATAPDMARFMLALLGGGELDGRRVLSDRSVAAMTSRQAGAHPALTGSGYGVWEEYSDGPRVVGHGGDLSGAHSQYVLVPEEDLGFFVAVNGDGSVADGNVLLDARYRIVKEFLAEFAGTGRGGAEPSGGSALSAEEVAQLRRYAGSYTSTRASRGEPSAALTLFSSVSVEATADGLRTTDPLLGERHWAPVEPGVFRSAEGDRLAFIERDGEVVGLGLDLVPSQNYERAPWYDSPALHLAVALGALLVLATVAVWPVLALVRRLRDRPGTAPAAARAARWAAGGAAVLCVGFTVLTAVLLSDMHLAETLVLTGSPLLTVPLTVAAAAAVAALAGAVWAWPARWWGGAGRIHHTLVALAAVAFVAVGARYGLTLLPL